MKTGRCKVKGLFVAALLAFFFALSTVSAQQVVASGGNHHEACEISISWTLGETVIETFTTEENTLTQGFHQPQLTVVAVDEIVKLGYMITAFPNPVQNYVTLSVEAENYENLTFRLYDFNGRLIEQNPIQGNLTNVSFEALNPAVYFITILEENKKITTLKIIKN